MSTDQLDDDIANGTDQPEDKHVLVERRDILREITTDPKQCYRTKDDSKDNNNESRISGDICRICHMGGYPRNEEDRGTRTRQSRTVGQVDSETSTISSYSYLGPLISACKCRGTVALVHAECLERWLTESGHTRCELCGYKYATKRVPRYNIFRSIAIWFNTVIVTRQMFLDVLYLIVTTPLALFSCYICALALRMLIKNRLHNVPWMIVAMLPTCSLTLVAYWGWIITLGRLHGRRWRRYWRSNFVIRLVPDDAILAESTLRREQASSDRPIEQFDHWRSMNDESTDTRDAIGRSG
ncbi:E3 ubiquitin-protein ligase MARCHF2-like isoform X1 [Osmia bicornis bicornis]|uniref:E3 ubiquitin-protein ligase MARCHF2-like isoform X1 n=1 Tax=Osmia bicornis bicornis TaxID=1437191 RepID=UPI0010F8CD9B|nr:E3 ubiquitin-protein ligase MARCHF2-like isoform X1 [Osmia bicornis bicornis]